MHVGAGRNATSSYLSARHQPEVTQHPARMGGGCRTPASVESSVSADPDDVTQKWPWLSSALQALFEPPQGLFAAQQSAFELGVVDPLQPAGEGWTGLGA